MQQVFMIVITISKNMMRNSFEGLLLLLVLCLLIMIYDINQLF